jgi:hypothetical protein
MDDPASSGPLDRLTLHTFAALGAPPQLFIAGRG